MDRDTLIAGRYRVERELGAGGMATVYLAHDLKHERRVALKVLRPELSAVIGAQRFLGEIKTTANLQHAHILSLFDSGELDGTVFYVMPFVDGESLRDRLTRENQLPVPDALRIAREVAEALAYAHERGVIHRDIKPENILLQGGHAVVADFGIALAVSHTGGNRLTETGMSLGTPAYMSPEQAMGERTLDARTDIYALGCVLYEMLVGEPPFTGPTAQAIVARVMTEEPRSITAQRRTVPVNVEAAVETALSKLPADRFASAAEFAAALSADAVNLTRPVGQRHGAKQSSRTAALTALGIALAAATGAAIWGWMRPQPAARVARSYVRFPDAEAPTLTRSSYALLPDGSALVYVGPAAGSSRQIWLKKRAELHGSPLGGTTGASSVFPSPDSKWIGFIANAKLKKVPVSGGEAITLADAACGSIACPGGEESGTWLDDGRIAFVSRGGLVALSASGSQIDTLVRSEDIGGLAAILPVAIPGSRGLLFTGCTLYCNKAVVAAVDLTTHKTTTLVENAMFPRYSPTGHLLYVDASGSAVAVPFDLSTLTIQGKPTPILDRVAGALTMSSDGTLAYAEGDNASHADLVVVSRDGRTVQSVDSTWRGNFGSLDLSHDGRRVAASVISEGQEHVWIKRLDADEPPFKVTFGKTQNTTPEWTADGASILFTRFEGTQTATFLSKRADGTGPEHVVKSGSAWVIESAASRDGQWIALREYDAGKRQIFARRTTGDTVERLVVTAGANGQAVSPTISPDSKWLAYASEENGPREVWVVPFPSGEGAKWQISTNGGFEPVWSPNGREIFYVTPQNEMMAVEMATAGGFAIGKRRMLFRVDDYHRHFSHRAYDVTPDGQRFIMIRNGDAPRGELVVVDNWLTELAQRAGK